MSPEERDERRERTPTPVDDLSRTPPPGEAVTEREIWTAEKRGKVRLEELLGAALRVASTCAAELKELETGRADWATVRSHLAGTMRRRAVDLERLETLLMSEMP